MEKIITNDGKKGGLLKGKRHYDENGESLGGIKAVVTDAGGKPVELEGGEVIINREASKLHWKKLSEINQSAGNGVPIQPPDGVDEDPEEFKEGGKIIEFNRNDIPNRNILSYAKKIKENYPKVWDLGGNIFGNEAFKNLKRVAERGYWLDSEEWMYKKWRSFVARHQRDYRIPGVIAMLKWVDKVEKGWPYMKNLIEEEIEKRYPKASKKLKKGGNVDEKVLEERWEKKKSSISQLANNIRSLRNNITRDLSSEDEKTALTALVISIIDSTAERVGNDNSADNGHYGVTGFKKKHIKIDGNRITLKYIGKSGVEHDNSFSDEKIANYLKKAIENSPNEYVFTTSKGFEIKANKVNRYLKDFNVSAKDLRGYSANKWVIEKLKNITPESKDTKRKKQFNDIVSIVAEKIGHGKATLKKHYLVPELEEIFIKNGTIINIKEIGGEIMKDGDKIENQLNNDKNEKFKENNENKENKNIENTISYISRGIRTIEEKQSRSLSKNELKDLESQLAFEFAKKSNLWIESIDSLPMPIKGGGNENSLYYDEKNGIIYKSNNLFNNDFSIINYLTYILNHNKLFKNTQYKFEGFIGFSNNYENNKKAIPYIEPVVSQKFIIGSNASIEDIEEYMKKINFEKVNDFAYKNENFIVSDLRPRNVIKDENGNIYIIDNIIFKKNVEMKKGGSITYKEKYNKKYGYDKSESHDLKEIAKDTGVSKKGLQQIYNKGVGAYNTNPQSVRPTVKSEEQWGMGRVYSAVMGGKAAKIDAKELKMALGGILEENNPINQILEKVKPYQDELTQRWVDVVNKEGEIKLTESDIEMYQYVLVMDLVKAIGNHLEKTDLIKDLKFSKDQSSIVISCIVVRDGKEYNFSTEVIIAGGYNIQKLHLRYIVHTKLENKKGNAYYEKLNEQYKKMTKAQKIQEQISYAKNAIAKYEVKLNEAKENSKLSDEEVEKLSREDKPNSWGTIDTTWETIVERGADKNFDYSKEKYLESQKEYKKSTINFWRTFNGNYRQYENMIKREQKEIDKLNKKLADLGGLKMQKGGTMKNIEKGDIAFGFTLHGLKSTDKPNVMYHNLFDVVKDIETAMKNAEVMFKVDPTLSRVEIEGNKSRKLYYIVIRNEDGTLNFESNENGDLISTQVQNVVLEGKQYGEKTSKEHFDFIDKFKGKDISSVVRSIYKFPTKELYEEAIDYSKKNKIKISYLNEQNRTITFDDQIMALGGNIEDFKYSKEFAGITIYTNHEQEYVGKMYSPFESKGSFAAPIRKGDLENIAIESPELASFNFQWGVDDWKLIAQKLKNKGINKLELYTVGKWVKEYQLKTLQNMALGGNIEDELSIIIKGVTNENKYKGNYKKIFDLIEKDLAFYNPYGTSFEELRDNDFYITITPKPESLIIDKISKLQGVEIVDNDIRYKQGGELEKGIEAEKEHIDTAKKLFEHKISPEQSAESIAKEHLKEDPKYYTKLEKIENPKKMENLYYLSKGSCVTEKSSGYTMCIEGYTNDAVLVKKVARFENHSALPWKFEHIIDDINKGLITFDGKDYSSDRDKALLLLEIETIKDCCKMAKGGKVIDVLSKIEDKKYSTVTKSWGDIHIIPTSNDFWDEIKNYLDKYNIKYTIERYDVGTEYFKIKDEDKYEDGGNIEKKLDEKETLSSEHVKISNKINDVYKKYEALFNQQYAKFNKEQKEGMEKLNSLGLAYIESGKEEDKKDYDNYGKEYNKIFENHNETLKKLSEERDSIVKDLNKQLSEITDELFSKMKDGGKIENQYENMSPSEIWSAWNFNQKLHFLEEHIKLSSRDRSSYAELDYSDLPETVQDVLHFHTKQGQYDKGGNITFSIDNPKLDEVLNEDFIDELDYEEMNGDSFYSLKQSDYNRFLDKAHSLGLQDSIFNK